MTRKLSITTVVAVGALSIGVPAAFGGVHAGGESAPVLAQPDPMIEDGFARAVRQASVPVIRDAHERVVGGKPQWLKALAARSEGLNEQYGLGEYSTTATYSDSFYRAEPPRGAVPVSVTSGTEIEWPQIGVGLGIGLLLALGLGLIMRTAHIRPFAH